MITFVDNGLDAQREVGAPRSGIRLSQEEVENAWTTLWKAGALDIASTLGLVRR